MGYEYEIRRLVKYAALYIGCVMAAIVASVTLISLVVALGFWLGGGGHHPVAK